jgi:hypothetical protein
MPKKFRPQGDYWHLKVSTLKVNSKRRSQQSSHSSEVTEKTGFSKLVLANTKSNTFGPQVQQHYYTILVFHQHKNIMHKKSTITFISTLYLSNALLKPDKKPTQLLPYEWQCDHKIVPLKMETTQFSDYCKKSAYQGT